MSRDHPVSGKSNEGAPRRIGKFLISIDKAIGWVRQECLGAWTNINPSHCEDARPLSRAVPCGGSPVSGSDCAAMLRHQSDIPSGPAHTVQTQTSTRTLLRTNLRDVDRGASHALRKVRTFAYQVLRAREHECQRETVPYFVISSIHLAIETQSP